MSGKPGATTRVRGRVFHLQVSCPCVLSIRGGPSSSSKTVLRLRLSRVVLLGARARRSNADERVCTVRPILALEGWHRDNFLECKAEAALCLVHMVDDERLVLLLAREASYHRIHLVRYRAQPAQPAAWRRITTSGALCSIWRTTTRLDQFSLRGCTSDSAGDAILPCRGEDFTAPIETDTKQAVSVIKRSELTSSSSGIVMVNQRNLRRL